MLVGDLVRVLLVLPLVEWNRRRLPFEQAALRCRGVGMGRMVRTGERRAGLQRLIRRVDRLWPTGPNCFRRVLLELILDKGAAGQPVFFGLVAGGGPGSGHAWLAGGLDDRGRSYDLVFSA